MTELISKALADSIDWTVAAHDQFLNETATAIAENIEKIRSNPPTATPMPKIFADLGRQRVDMSGRGRGAATLQQMFENCD